MTTYLILAGSAFVAQALLFVPVVPLLLLAGALVAHGTLRASWAALALAAGIAAGDFLWYVAGRLGGAPVLKRVCRLGMEPDTCARATQKLFGRYGARALLIAKFIPGLSTVALPLAGASGMHARRFAVYDMAGALSWTCAYLAIGYVAGTQVGSAREMIVKAPVAAAAVALGGVCVYLLWKHRRRLRIGRQLSRIDRISVGELRRKLHVGEEGHEPVVTVDLRHRIDFEQDPNTIPNALYIPAEDLADRRAEIPRDREIVLYCTCPNECTSAKWALWLRAMGVREVRPLEGGFAAWRGSGLPVTFLGPVVPPEEWVLNAA